MSNSTAPISTSDLIVWLGNQQWSSFAMSLAKAARSGFALSPAQIEAARSMHAKVTAREQSIQQARQKQADPSKRVTEPGVYEANGIVYRVKKSRTYSGRLYAMRYFPDAAEGHRFQYVPGAMGNITPEDRMTLERAKALGHQWGQCCICGRNLTAEKSVEDGIGPICAKRI